LFDFYFKMKSVSNHCALDRSLTLQILSNRSAILGFFTFKLLIFVI